MKVLIISLALFLFGGWPGSTSNMNQEKYNDSVENQVSTGIQFQKMTLAEAKAESAKSGKLIFIDAYTTWCGPCKLLERNTFSNAEVGTKFNSKFINLRVEMESDKDAPELYQTYSITAYPTMLFLDSNGKLVKRVLGYRDAPTLLKDVAEL